MATISFKAKSHAMHSVGGELLYTYITVPQFTRKHCDIAAFRAHSKYGPYANSDLFAGMLSHIRKNTFKNGILKLHEVPEGVRVDASGFLVSVSFDV